VARQTFESIKKKEKETSHTNNQSMLHESRSSSIPLSPRARAPRLAPSQWPARCGIGGKLKKKKKRKEKQRNVQVKQVQRPRTRAPEPPGWPALKSRIHQLWTSADFADDPRIDGKSRCQKLIYLLLFLLTTHGDQHDSIGTLDYFLLLLRPGHIV
jgi:hypothetical protein